MNRNTKRYPQEEITSLKKRGKRLRGGYLLAKLKNWKSSGTKPEIDRPKTIKPKPLTTKRKTQPKQKIEAKGRAIPKSIEIKPVKTKKTISKQPKQKVEAKGRAIPKSIETKQVEKKARKPRQQSVNKVVVEKIKQAEQKPVFTAGKIDIEKLEELSKKWDNITANDKKEEGIDLNSYKLFSEEISKIYSNKEIDDILSIWKDNSENDYKENKKLLAILNSVVSTKNMKKWGQLWYKRDQFVKYYFDILEQLQRKAKRLSSQSLEKNKQAEQKPVETEKKYYSTQDLGRGRYSVSYSGNRKNRDGSLQPEFHIFSTKKAQKDYVKKLEKEGYLYSSGLETQKQKDLKKYGFNIDHVLEIYKLWREKQKSVNYSEWKKYFYEQFRFHPDNFMQMLNSTVDENMRALKTEDKSLNNIFDNEVLRRFLNLFRGYLTDYKEERGQLFDNFNPNTEQELQAIAQDIPAFGDDVNEEKFELDGKYNLPEVVQKRDNMEVASVKDIKTMRFKALTLPSKYRQLLGKVPANFRMLLWGSPGHGKSSLALTIANDIGKFVKTLYVSAEESLQSATLSSRIKRFKANARNLMFNDSNNPDILDRIIMTQNPKFVVIDSVNVMIGKTEAIINLMLKYPEVGFIIIAQATKDKKKYAGLGSLAHAVDIVVNVRSGIAVAEKNRYAQLGSMPVKGIKI